VFVDRLTCSGFSVIRENGRTTFPGVPFTISRISKDTGMRSSLVAKKISIFVINAPPFCYTKNDCASGSHQPVSETIRSEV
jgi:hypothetical protein